MGVPAFYKWIQKTFQVVFDIPIAPDDTTKKIVEGMTELDGGEPKIDHLYLDCNGILHRCASIKGYNIDMMLHNIAAYLEFLVGMIKPKQTLFLAIDGVAPRAKINQQRARRYRTASRRGRLRDEVVRLRKEWGQANLPTDETGLSSFDRNVITPGTGFMRKVGDFFHAFAQKKLRSGDPLWEQLKIIVSDCFEPGEGEHKIMHYLRTQAPLDGCHAVYGLDADLIFLCLLQKQRLMRVIRDQTDFDFDHFGDKKASERRLIQMVDIESLKKLLAIKLCGDEKEELSAKREASLIRDFCFLVMILGNDFVPHTPSLTVGNGGVNFIMRIYKNNYLPENNGETITEDGVLRMHRLQNFIRHLAHNENRRLCQLSGKFGRMGSSRRNKDLTMAEKVDMCRNCLEYYFSVKNLPTDRFMIGLLKHNNGWVPMVSLLRFPRLKKMGCDSEIFLAAAKKSDLVVVNRKKTAIRAAEQHKLLCPEKKFSDEVAWARRRLERIERKDARDKLKLGRKGWRSRWYKQLAESSDIDSSVKDVCNAYFKTLIWILEYYTRGLVAWDYYYPYHYAPTLADLAEHRVSSELITTFNTESKPLSPQTQLISILPPKSARHLPACYRQFLQPGSALKRFYPDEFECNNALCFWEHQGVALLPFLDIPLVIKKIKRVQHLKTEQEKSLDKSRKAGFYTSEGAEHKDIGFRTEDDVMKVYTSWASERGMLTTEKMLRLLGIGSVLVAVLTLPYLRK